MKKELISVILPTYNREKLIAKSIESVLSQTYNNIEIIVVDDGSLDNTKDVVLSLDNKKIRYFKLKNNMGACFARNFGVEHSKGSVIAFQDSDSIWFSNKLEEEYNFMIKNNFDLVFCKMNRYEINKEYFVFPKVKNKVKNIYEKELEKSIMSTQTILVRRNVFKDIKFDNTFKRFQDWDFSIRVAKKYKVGYLPKVLLDDFVQENSISVNNDYYNSMHFLYEKHYQEIKCRPKINSIYISIFGDCFRKTDSTKAKEYYKESLKLDFNTKTLIKFIISALRIKI